MWILLTFLHAFFMALVNYMDEYLTHNSPVLQTESIHKKVWGLILITMLFSIFTLGFFFVFIDDFSMSQRWVFISLFSAFPMWAMFASYFYLFQKYPAHQVVPLFGLSSVWLLVLELVSWVTVTFLPILGVLFLLFGAYILDTRTLSWVIPTRLLFLMIPVSFLWAFSLFLARIVSVSDSISVFFIYQYVGIFFLGILLFLCVKPYREGFLQRVQKQGKVFVGGSIINEWFAQISFYSSMLAVSLAPLATYVSAISSIQYIFLFLLFFFFPLHKRNSISLLQVFAISLMIIGIGMIEVFQ